MAPAPIVDPPVVPDRCPASVRPGHHCGRVVAVGETLCENHLAMGSPI